MINEQRHKYKVTLRTSFSLSLCWPFPPPPFSFSPSPPPTLSLLIMIFCTRLSNENSHFARVERVCGGVGERGHTGFCGPSPPPPPPPFSLPSPLPPVLGAELISEDEAAQRKLLPPIPSPVGKRTEGTRVRYAYARTDTHTHIHTQPTPTHTHPTHPNNAKEVASNCLTTKEESVRGNHDLVYGTHAHTHTPEHLLFSL